MTQCRPWLYHVEIKGVHLRVKQYITGRIYASKDVKYVCNERVGSIQIKARNVVQDRDAIPRVEDYRSFFSSVHGGRSKKLGRFSHIFLLPASTDSFICCWHALQKESRNGRFCSAYVRKARTLSLPVYCCKWASRISRHSATSISAQLSGPERSHPHE